MNEPNNNQIDNTSYYTLPCGRQLEDYMWMRGMNGPMWSCVKYLYRSGKKHGESTKKDTDKAWHFAGFLSANLGNVRAMWFARAMAEVVCAIKWDGVRYVTNAEVSIEAMKVDMEIIGASSIKKDNVK